MTRARRCCPSLQPTSPPDTPPCRPILAAVTEQRKATVADPATGEEDPQGPPLTIKKTHRGAHLRRRRRPAGRTPGSRPARPPANAVAPPPPPVTATVGADARSPRCPWPTPPGPRSGRPSPPTAATAPSRHRHLLPPCRHAPTLRPAPAGPSRGRKVPRRRQHWPGFARQYVEAAARGGRKEEGGSGGGARVSPRRSRESRGRERGSFPSVFYFRK